EARDTPIGARPLCHRADGPGAVEQGGADRRAAVVSSVSLSLIPAVALSAVRAPPLRERPHGEDARADNDLSRVLRELLKFARLGIGQYPPRRETQCVRQILDVRTQLNTGGRQRSRLVEQSAFAQP